MIDRSWPGTAETVKGLLGIRRNTPTKMFIIQLVSDGPNRGDISVRKYVANSTKINLRCCFNWAGIRGSLLRSSAKCVHFDISVSFTSILTAINATRTSNNNSALREIFNVFGDTTNKNKALTWNA